MLMGNMFEGYASIREYVLVGSPDVFVVCITTVGDNPTPEVSNPWA